MYLSLEGALKQGPPWGRGGRIVAVVVAVAAATGTAFARRLQAMSSSAKLGGASLDGQLPSSIANQVSGPYLGIR